jgi:hypothetical protein
MIPFSYGHFNETIFLANFLNPFCETSEQFPLGSCNEGIQTSHPALSPANWGVFTILTSPALQPPNYLPIRNPVVEY